MNFQQLHQQDTPLIICNVWDATSAKTAEKLAFNAIGTSSAAIANMLGYEDGENMAFSELLYVVKRILASSSLPLTVDIESGYSRDPLQTAAHIKALAELGVVGINIEDSVVTHERNLMDASTFTKYLIAVKKQLQQQNVSVFINVRTDTFLLGKDNALSETIKRINLYSTAGIDGIFVPCITQPEDIKAVTQSTDLPINVMCMPDLPDFNILSQLAVKRISMGNFIFDSLSNRMEETLTSVITTNSFEPVFLTKCP